MLVWAMVGVLQAAEPEAPAFREIVAGQNYWTEQRVGVKELGVSFVIPKGWAGGMPPGTEAFAMGADHSPGLILVWAEAGVTAKQIAADLGPKTLNGVKLAPRSPPRVDGQKVWATLEGTDGFTPHVAHIEGRVGDNGSSILVAGLTPVDGSGPMRETVTQIVGTFRFHKVDKPVTADGVHWPDKLRNQSLTVDERQLDLCANGRFFYQTTAEEFVINGGKSHGAWAVKGATLSLQFADQTTERWHLAKAGNDKTLIDGKPWAVTDSERCQ